MEYLIGDIVCGKPGNIISKGLVRDDIDWYELGVVCFEINNRPTRIILKIKKECIIKE